MSQRVRLVTGETAGRVGTVTSDADGLYTVRWDSGYPQVMTVFAKDIAPEDAA